MTEYTAKSRVNFIKLKIVITICLAMLYACGGSAQPAKSLKGKDLQKNYSPEQNRKDDNKNQFKSHICPL
jgi:hypothetical protein